jgi:serine-type anaerobic sulfatase-maturating enzyme
MIDKNDAPMLFGKCAYLKDCWGECPKNRFIRTPDGETGLNYLCAGPKNFFKHATPEIDRLVAGSRQEGLQAVERL